MWTGLVPNVIHWHLLHWLCLVSHCPWPTLDFPSPTSSAEAVANFLSLLQTLVSPLLNSTSQQAYWLFPLPIQGHRAAPTTLPRSPEPLTTVLWSECSLFWSWLLYLQILIALWNTVAFPHKDIIIYYDHIPFFLFPVLIISFLFPICPFVFFILNDSVSFIRVAFQDYKHLPSLFTSELYSSSLPGRGGASTPTPTSYCGLNGLSLIVASSVS